MISIEDYNKLIEEILNCKKCPLYKNINNKVIDNGNINSKIWLVGEAPGKNEDLLGKPFVGKAGSLLMKILKEELNLERKDVYITNVLKCRPPNNRDPKIYEIKICMEYLKKQIEILNPKILIALGRFSTGVLLYLFKIKNSLDFNISKYRGKLYKIKDKYILPTYHPAAIIYNKNLEPKFREDLRKIKNLINSI